MKEEKQNSLLAAQRLTFTTILSQNKNHSVVIELRLNLQLIKLFENRNRRKADTC